MQTIFRYPIFFWFGNAAALCQLTIEHISPNELVNVVEVARFRHAAVVVSVGQFLPNDGLGFA
jgi:hypothetical protein